MNSMTSFKVAALAGVILVAWATEADCQDLPVYNIVQPLAMSRQLFLPVEALRNRANAAEASASARGRMFAFNSAQVFAPGQTARPALAGASTTYRASPAVSARVKQQYIDFIRKTVGEQGAQEYGRVLARNDYVRNWAQLVAEDGLRAGDVADALAGYWMLNYMVANSLTEIAPGKGRVVASQARRALAGDPAYARLGEAQRQEMAEVFMLNFLTQQAAYTHAVTTGDKTLQRGLSEAAVARFQTEMGVDLRRLALTDAGFILRS